MPSLADLKYFSYSKNGVFFPCFTVMILAVISGCHGKMLYQHPDFSARPSIVHTIAVLEPRLDIVEITLLGDGKHKDVDDSNIIKMRNTLSESLTTLLELNGFSARQIGTAKMKGLGLQNLSTSHVDISARVFGDKKGRYFNLRDLSATDTVDADKSSGDLPIDAFLYSNYRRWCKSKGRVFTEQMLLFATAAAARSSTASSASSGCGSKIEVILIRASDKEILWANRVSSPSLVTELVAEQVLGEFPKTSASKVVK